MSRWPRVTDAEFLMARIAKTPDGCWNWTNKLAPNGYGRCNRNYRPGRLAHRFAYETLVGPIPDGLVLDHLCRNRACVNPDHLEPVTELENRGRGLHSPFKTVCSNGHPFTPENTYRYKGARQCRTCRREVMRRIRQERAA